MSIAKNAFIHHCIVLLVVRFVFLGFNFNHPFGNYATEQEFAVHFLLCFFFFFFFRGHKGKVVRVVVLE